MKAQMGNLDVQFERDVDKEEETQMNGKQELRRLMKGYYALDREDTINGVICRYPYIKVYCCAVRSVENQCVVRFQRKTMGWSPMTFSVWMTSN